MVGVRQALVVLALAALVAVAAAASLAAGGETKLEASLSGAAEHPKGDPDGLGSAQLTIAGTKLCWNVRVFAIGKPLAAHIHKGGASVGSGAVVVPLGAAFRATGCTQVAAKLADSLTAHPSAYYVNVHTAAFRNGAVRGQLARAERKPGY